MLNGSFDIRTLALLAGVLFYEQYRIEKRLTTLPYKVLRKAGKYFPTE
jgi:hypothetical protein